MASFFLIPWARTDWCDEGRLAATTGLPLNQDGRQQSEQYAASLEHENISVIYSSGNETGVATAKCIATRLGVPRKTIKGLGEPNLGLWEGLTADLLAKRYPKAYKKWLEKPTSVCPPEGEDIKQAVLRFDEAIYRLAVKHADKAVGLVLGPLAKAIIRCHLESIDLDRLWEKAEGEPTWHRIDLILDHADSANRTK